MARGEWKRIDHGMTESGARLDVVRCLTEPARRTRGARTKTKVDAMTYDSVALTRGGPVIDADVIVEYMKSLKLSGSLVNNSFLPKDIIELEKDLGGKLEFRWFMAKLRLRPEDSVKRVYSAYSPGFEFPVLEHTRENERILVTVERRAGNEQGRVQRESQRIVAAHTFHRSSYPMQDTVMVEAAGPEAAMQKLRASSRKKHRGCSVRQVWIAKVLAFLKVRRNGKQEQAEMPAPSTESQWALVQYFDVDNGILDSVDEALDCTKLKWARDVETNGKARRWFELVDVAAIRGLVHVVRGDYCLGSSITHRCEGDRRWLKQWFYLNRFKLARRGTQVAVAREA